MIYIYTLLVATSIYIYILYICMLVYICLRRYFITLFTKVCSITYEGTYFLQWYETYEVREFFWQVNISFIRK